MDKETIKKMISDYETNVLNDDSVQKMNYILTQVAGDIDFATNILDSMNSILFCIGLEIDKNRIEEYHNILKEINPSMVNDEGVETLKVFANSQSDNIKIDEYFNAKLNVLTITINMIITGDCSLELEQKLKSDFIAIAEAWGKLLNPNYNISESYYFISLKRGINSCSRS